MFFGSPEHLTFLRYEVLSPQRRYTCTCTFISTWDIKAYFSYQSHVNILCVETTCMGLKKWNCAASYLCPACGPRLVLCCQRALTPSAAPNQNHHHWPENSRTSPLQSHTQAHLYLLHTDEHTLHVLYRYGPEQSWHMTFWWTATRVKFSWSVQHWGKILSRGEI